MLRLTRCLFAPVVVTLAAAAMLRQAPAAATQDTPSLAQLLKTVGEYVAHYENAYSAIVSKETYVQRTFSAGQQQARTLDSEVILVAAGVEGWVIFRDVFAVDGKAIRDRQDRLTALFLGAERDLRSPALRIAEESSRYNLGPIARTINIPTLALLVVRPTHQARWTFRLGGRTTIDGLVTRELRFEESGTPRMIATRDQAGATGRLWVDPVKGTVVRTEFRLESEGSSATVTVTYALQPKLSLWLPVLMTEAYELPGANIPSNTNPRYRNMRPAGMSIDGRATYTGFRQFSVEVVDRIIR